MQNTFYKDYPKQRLDVLFPEIHEDDIVIVGSYYALNPVLRDKILELLETAKRRKRSSITIPISGVHIRTKLSS